MVVVVVVACRGNVIGGEGAAAISEALKVNTTLTKLKWAG